MKIKTKATPANIYRYILLVNVALIQAIEVAKDVYFNAVGHDCDTLIIKLDAAINISIIFRSNFMSFQSLVTNKNRVE